MTKWKHKLESKIEENLKFAHLGEGCGEFMGFQTVYCLQWAGKYFSDEVQIIVSQTGLRTLS